MEISAIVIHPSRSVDDALPRSSVLGRSNAEIPMQTLMILIFLGYTTILTCKLGVPVECHVMN